MNFKKKRTDAKLSKYTMAKELGMGKEKYEKVEKGELELPSDLIDKFLNITYNAKEILFNRSNKLAKINEWILSGQIKKDIKEQGYDTLKELAEVSGIHNSDISRIINNKHVCEDLKESLYDFLQNPLNKKVESQEKNKKGTKDMVEKKEEKVMKNIKKVMENIENEEIVNVECFEIERLKNQLETLENEVRELLEENRFLKTSIKHLFNI